MKTSDSKAVQSCTNSFSSSSRCSAPHTKNYVKKHRWDHFGLRSLDFVLRFLLFSLVFFDFCSSIAFTHFRSVCSKLKLSYHFSCEAKPNSRNGQVKMFETIAVLIVFFFLLVASAAVYFSVQKWLVTQKVQEVTAEKNIQLTQNILSLPELDCSFAAVQKENCFDLYKVHAFSILLLQERYMIDYFPVFGYSEVTLTNVYPNRQTLQVYSNKPTNVRTVLLSHYPVLLYNATVNTYSFAVIEVKSYGS